MAEKITIDFPILVEGKYDRIKLTSVLNADIFQTDGFGIFKKDELKDLLLRLCERSPVIILTDSDGGGVQIRRFCLSFLPKDRVINLYVPEVPGKEKRKAAPSKAGLLGVEGIDAETLRKLFLPFASGTERKRTGGITKTDLYVSGLSGGVGSEKKRAELCLKLGLPRNMTANALLTALNVLYTAEEFRNITAGL